MSVPKSAEEITPAWLMQAVADHGRERLDGLSTVRAQEVGDYSGVTTRIVRLGLDYEPGGRGPPSLVAKLATGAREMREAARFYGFYKREVAFYASLADTLSLRTPRCWAAVLDEETHDFALVMEDLGRWTRTDQVDGLTLEQARRAVDALASLHLEWWARPELVALTEVIQPLAQPPYSNFGMRHAAAWNRFEDFLKGRVSPSMLRLGEKLAGALDGLVASISDGPLTLCHGDFRADNLLFEPGGAGLAVVDWQMSTQARGAFDVGYLLSGSVQSADRRAWELDLLRNYHARLIAGGVAGYEFATCLADYRNSALVAFTYCVQGGAASDLSNPRIAALFDCIARRCEAAVNDLHLHELVG